MISITGDFNTGSFVSSDLWPCIQIFGILFALSPTFKRPLRPFFYYRNDFRSFVTHATLFTQMDSNAFFFFIIRSTLFVFFLSHIIWIFIQSEYAPKKLSRTTMHSQRFSHHQARSCSVVFFSLSLEM